METSEKKKCEPDAIDRVSFVLALVVCAIIFYGNVKPEIEYYGTTQVYETECWIPEGSFVTTDEEQWHKRSIELNAKGLQVDLSPNSYKQLLENERGHSVFITKDTIRYLAESGKAVFTTSKYIPDHPRIGEITNITYAGNNELEWRVEFTSRSLVLGIIRGLLIGLIIGAISFFIWALIILLLIHAFKKILKIRRLMFV